MTLIVFAGPTLPAATITGRLACRVLPPAGQGDVWRAVHRYAPTAIGLVDGVFRGTRAVWHRELLWALSRGVHVLGAASMGALRAAELHPFGMAGIGRVFAAYRAARWPGYEDAFEDDDEVAVEHAPAELGHAPLSTAMVDLRDTLLAAQAASAISPAERQALFATLKATHYPARRTPQALAAYAVHTKQADALALLDALRPLAKSPPFVPAFRLQPNVLWTRFVTGQNPMDEPTLDEAGLLRLLRAAPVP